MRYFLFLLVLATQFFSAQTVSALDPQKTYRVEVHYQHRDALLDGTRSGHHENSELVFSMKQVLANAAERRFEWVLLEDLTSEKKDSDICYGLVPGMKISFSTDKTGRLLRINDREKLEDEIRASLTKENIRKIAETSQKKSTVRQRLTRAKNNPTPTVNWLQQHLFHITNYYGIPFSEGTSQLNMHRNIILLANTQRSMDFPYSVTIDKKSDSLNIVSKFDAANANEADWKMANINLMNDVERLKSVFDVTVTEKVKFTGNIASEIEIVQVHRNGFNIGKDYENRSTVTYKISEVQP